ncbi:LOW QUALITY PROTEIN: hypothetical protein OSB04_003368 [Centaurea solstitialis]|uniref:Exonuclease domain-containing protein n=1 Tax=Centaurea solstitialis TaxID=347529 RepID=A0AA38UBZ4_9ASTR|nr:LOW QUALITY PROTEIN: hypothetical protein OSB04_003368 [Centaurea solstitialis]
MQTLQILCGVLDACDDLAKRSMDSDSNSEWRPVVSRKPGFYDSPTVRLHLPTEAGDTTRWMTEIYHKKSLLLPAAQQLVSGSYDVAELDALIRPGSLVDAYFSLDPYNYHQNAGIRLVAKKLIYLTHSSDMVSTGDRPEIAFFDLETTIPTRQGQGYAILEFGSILVCPKKLVELESYETLVRPHDLSLISTLSVRANGISADDVVSAPAFSDIADRVYDILHGRVWAGHNILRFDCVRLREAYAQINRPPPEPKGTIDSLALLTQRFGRRAGNMKMATLAAYFGLGRQSHRSLDDVRLNLEVLKYCATVLFLESSLPDIFTDNNWASLNSTTSYRYDGRSTREGTGSNTNALPSSRNIENYTFPPNPTFSVVTPGEQVPTPVDTGSARSDPFQMGHFVDEMESESLQSNEAMVAESSTTTPSDAVSNRTEFIEPDEVSIASITAAVVPFFNGYQKIQMLHRDIPMQIRCDGMMVRFGLSTKYVDHAGRARLSFVVDGNSSNLCGVLDACDDIAKRFVDSDSNSEWRPVVSRKPGFYDSPTLTHCSRRYHQMDDRDIPQEIIVIATPNSFSYDVAELDALIRPGFLVDAYFSLDPYNYQQNAGIRLVAKKLIVHTN